MSSLAPLAIGGIGPMEITLIFIVVLLIFGPKSLPSLGRSFGQGLREFKKASSKFTEAIEDIDKEVEEEERQTKRKPSTPQQLPREDSSSLYDREPPMGSVSASGGSSSAERRDD